MIYVCSISASTQESANQYRVPNVPITAAIRTESARLIKNAYLLLRVMACLGLLQYEVLVALARDCGSLGAFVLLLGGIAPQVRPPRMNYTAEQAQHCRTTEVMNGRFV